MIFRTQKPQKNVQDSRFRKVLDLTLKCLLWLEEQGEKQGMGYQTFEPGTQTDKWPKRRQIRRAR